MKPYVLNYSETRAIQHNASIQSRDSTLVTETIENSDDDEIIAHSTKETFCIESSDNDEFRANYFGSTWCTDSIEPTDDDEMAFISDTTLMTKSIEPSDDDEIFLF